MRRHAFFLVILAVAAVSRFVVLFTSQTHVHSDEAIIGLMGKHIVEGRYLPFYMYGQAYNAGAAWEAYLAAISFAFFDVGVIPLKACIVVLSLACLVAFYIMAYRLYGMPTAAWASLAFALSPSLFKWHFQVRGYSWYFLSIPLLVLLFWSIDQRPSPKGKRTFWFGVVSGVFVWCLELVLAPVGALWLLLVLRRKLTLKEGALGLAGFLTGYLPTILFNLFYHFANWRVVFLVKTAGGGQAPTFQKQSLAAIFSDELPKFFGPDTVLWYYPEKPLSGYFFYALAIAAVGLAIWPFLKTPSNIWRALRGASGEEDKDFLMVVLTLACFAPYLSALVRAPSYFLAGCFFLSLLTGRLLARCFAAGNLAPRIVGAGLVSAIVLVGTWVYVDVGRHNVIETLTMNRSNEWHMTRIPGSDIDAVENRLRNDKIQGVFATMSFVYPLIFESREKMAVSGSAFNMDYPLYPKGVPRQRPQNNQRTAFVMETDSPFPDLVVKGLSNEGKVASSVLHDAPLTLIEAKAPLK
jgi:hypothetical protein